MSACDGGCVVRQTYLSRESQNLAEGHAPNPTQYDLMPESVHQVQESAELAYRQEGKDVIRHWENKLKDEMKNQHGNRIGTYNAKCHMNSLGIINCYDNENLTDHESPKDSDSDSTDDICVSLFSVEGVITVWARLTDTPMVRRLLALLLAIVSLYLASSVFAEDASEQTLSVVAETRTVQQEHVQSVPRAGCSPKLPCAAKTTLERVEQLGLFTGEVVVTGTAAGLPRGHGEDMFDGDCISDLLKGRSCLEVAPDSAIQPMLGMGVTKPSKDPATGKRVLTPLDTPDCFARVRSVVGALDLTSQFGVPAHVVDTLDTTSKLALAAGIQAMQSARLLPQGGGSCVLAEEDQEETGVIFASSFPALDSLVEEVEAYVTHKMTAAGEAEREQLISQLISALPADQQDEAKQVVAAAAGDKTGPATYAFNRKLLFKLLVMGNSQLAEMVKAKGPNMQMNAACAGTTHAVAQAECWIRNGWCKRVVVVAADNPTSENLFQWISTGFVAMGAASTAKTVEGAALPFNASRNGMVLGAGAVGMVIEAEPAALARGVTPKSTLVATQVANSAFHPCSLDRHHISRQLQLLMKRVQGRCGITAQELAKQCLYVSHETFTSCNGGCAGMEVNALLDCFGREAAEALLVLNSKAYTGHSMGVCFEDVVAVEALDQGVAPAVANMAPGQQDQSLGCSLNLHKGGGHSAKYALRFAAGFGNQVVYLMYKRYEA